MAINSRAKGANFEREIVTELRESFGFSAAQCYRVPMSGGFHAHNKTDIAIIAEVADSFPFWIECKRWKQGFDLYNLTKLEHAVFDQASVPVIDGDKLERNPLIVMKPNQRAAIVLLRVAIPSNYATYVLTQLWEPTNRYPYSVIYDHRGRDWWVTTWATFLEICTKQTHGV